MKIAAISDLHLTNSLPHTVSGTSDRKDLLIRYLFHFFAEIKKRKAKFLIIPGDICHQSVLYPDDMDLLFTLFELVIKSDIPTLIIDGNHDQDGDKSILQSLEHLSRLFPKVYYSRKPYWRQKFKNVAFDMINFCSHNDFLDRAQELAATKHRKKYSVLVGHIGIKGALHGSTKSIVGVKPEDIERLGEHYDSIILGHFHNFQWITDKCFFVGAPHQTRIDEINNIPSGLLVDLPSLKTRRIHNNYSPQFYIIKDYKFEASEIEDNIVKPELDLINKTEEENLKFLDSIEACNPYMLIRPRVKKVFQVQGSPSKFRKSKKTQALMDTMKTIKAGGKRKKKEFREHTVNVWEKVKQ